MSGSKNSQSRGESWLLSAAANARLIWAKCRCFLTNGKSQNTLMGRGRGCCMLLAPEGLSSRA